MYLLYLVICVVSFKEIIAFRQQNPTTKCPPAAMTNPCICQNTNILFEDYVELSCSNITNHETLSDVFRRTGDYQFGGLTLINSNIQYLPSNMFNITIKKFLRIGNSSLVTLFDRLPIENNDLNHIILDNITVINGLDWSYISSFKNLSNFLFNGMTPIKTIGKNFFINMPKNVQMLMLQNSSVSKLEDNCFSALQNLHAVAVTGGNITELKRNMFSSPSKIGIFMFSFNKISSLPDNLFDDMPLLFLVSLRNNFLSTISEKIFKVPNLRLDLEDNPINCNCDISWIVKTEYYFHDLDGECAEPINLKGKLLWKLEKKDFIDCGNNTKKYLSYELTV